MSDSGTQIRAWLVENGYDDVRAKIDHVMEEWARKGLKTRRNWWDILAGTPNGQPRKIAGVEFPVLAAARRRKGWSSAPTEIRKSRKEKPPAIKPQARWDIKKS